MSSEAGETNPPCHQLSPLPLPSYRWGRRARADLDESSATYTPTRFSSNAALSPPTHSSLPAGPPLASSPPSFAKLSDLKAIRACRATHSAHSGRHSRLGNPASPLQLLRYFEAVERGVGGVCSNWSPGRVRVELIVSSRDGNGLEPYRIGRPSLSLCSHLPPFRRSLPSPDCAQSSQNLRGRQSSYWTSRIRSFWYVAVSTGVTRKRD